LIVTLSIFLSCPMQLRTKLANCKTTIWIGLSYHSFIGWAQVTPMENQFYSVSYFYFFSLDSPMVFSYHSYRSLLRCGILMRSQIFIYNKKKRKWINEHSYSCKLKFDQFSNHTFEQLMLIEVNFNKLMMDMMQFLSFCNGFLDKLQHFLSSYSEKAIS
jgi:hypothetical protein